MVCNRCIKVVKDELELLNLKVNDIKLGEVTLAGAISHSDLSSIKAKLEENGFELLDDKRAQTIEKIKNVIISLIHHNEPAKLNANFSDLIAEKIGQDYNYLSNLFSSTENLTIEKFIILQRIERVKELLVYNEYTLSEIAYQAGYSSVQHLSAQFKKITGLTPGHFKAIKENRRKGLDEIS